MGDMVLCLATTGHKQHELYMTNPRVPNTSYIPSAHIGVRVGSTGLRVGSARLFGYQEQCSILTFEKSMHLPGAQVLGPVHPVCTFWWPGAQVLKPVHPAGACFFQIFNIII